MKYIELIPILLFALMLIIDRRQLGKISQLVKEFEQRNLDAEISTTYLCSETLYAFEYNNEEPAEEVKISEPLEFKNEKDLSKPSVIIMASTDFSW
jgi:hypothetical protein